MYKCITLVFDVEWHIIYLLHVEEVDEGRAAVLCGGGFEPEYLRGLRPTSPRGLLTVIFSWIHID